jgi:hypothetical protein
MDQNEGLSEREGPNGPTGIDFIYVNIFVSGAKHPFHY